MSGMPNNLAMRLSADTARRPEPGSRGETAFYLRWGVNASSPALTAIAAEVARRPVNPMWT